MEGWQQLLAAVGACCQCLPDCRCLVMEVVPGAETEDRGCNSLSPFRDRLL